MVLMGFRPAQAAAIVLVGHAWAVTFGSLGSSYYTIQLVSGIEGEVIGPHMAAMFALPIVATGFAVAHLEGGMKSVRRGAPTIVVMGAAMAGSVWTVAAIGAPQIASIASGLVGCGVGWAVARTWLLPGREPDATPSADGETAAAPKAGLGVPHGVPALLSADFAEHHFADPGRQGAGGVLALGPRLSGRRDGSRLRGGRPERLRPDQVAAPSGAADTGLAGTDLRRIPVQRPLAQGRGRARRRGARTASASPPAWASPPW